MSCTLDVIKQSINQMCLDLLICSITVYFLIINFTQLYWITFHFAVKKTLSGQTCLFVLKTSYIGSDWTGLSSPQIRRLKGIAKVSPMQDICHMVGYCVCVYLTWIKFTKIKQNIFFRFYSERNIHYSWLLVMVNLFM